VISSFPNEAEMQNAGMDNKDTIRIDPDSGEFSSMEKIGLLQIISGEDIGREFELKPGNNIVGRQKDCSVHIINSSISRRHAQIECDPNASPDRRYIIFDLQSTNGTRVNNENTSQLPLRDGDRVQFGKVVCKFMEVDPLEKNFLKEIQKLIEYDDRTELLQIKPFYKRLEKALSVADSSSQSLTVLMMDLDGLKQINEAHGHIAGSHVIVEIARLTSLEFSPSGVVGLYGGDEFAAYLENIRKSDAVIRAEKLRSLVAGTSFEEKGIEKGVTISIGMAEYPKDATEMMQLISCADKALYVAKSSGKNRVVQYDPSMQESTKK
jgi:two-component system cell cycle response regulator